MNVEGRIRNLPFERRFFLALDVSEIFKPIIIDRIILKLVNKNMLDDACFRGEIGDMLLSDKGKAIPDRV